MQIPNDTLVFELIPWQVEALRDQSPILLMTGSAGGGKSLAAYWKCVLFALTYPGANVLVTRKELDDCGRSIIPTLDDRILKPILATRSSPNLVAKSEKSRCYRFLHNNSRIWWSGLRTEDDRKAIRSMGAGGSLDMILMEEGIQFAEEDLDELRGRLRGNAADWRQLIVATNPDGPLHWINTRLIIGQEASVHVSNARLNPYNPQDYLDSLDAMTGVEGDRLARGRWVEATGLVIDSWTNQFNSYTGDDGGGNVSLKADHIPGEGRVICAVDDGYTGVYDERIRSYTAASHPRVFLFAQIRPNGQIAIFHEDYAVKERYKTQIDRVIDTLRGHAWPRPSEVHYDKSSATFRAELDEAGFSPLFPSTSKREESIRLLNERTGADENGFRTIIVHPRCHNLILEMASWTYRNGVPAKQFDHGCFVEGTMIMTDCGEKPVELIRPGDIVLTRKGYFPVEIATMTNAAAQVMTVEFGNGRALTGTPDHPVYTPSGLARLDAMRYGMYTLGISSEEASRCPGALTRLCIRVSRIAAIPMRLIGLIECTIRQVRLIADAATTTFIASYGATSLAKFPMVITSTTKTGIRSITSWETSRASRRRSMPAFIKTFRAKRRDRDCQRQRYGLPQSGTEATRVAGGMNSTDGQFGKHVDRDGSFASIAEGSTKPARSAIIAFARPIAGRIIGACQALMTKLGCVLHAAMNSLLTGTPKAKRVLVRVERSSVSDERQAVYNLKIGGGGPSEYYANGILVSNCDALRYLLWNLERGISTEGAVGYESSDSEVNRRIEQRMADIDRAIERFEAQL
jgi:hypothetical protein